MQVPTYYFNRTVLVYYAPFILSPKKYLASGCTDNNLMEPSNVNYLYVYSI